MRTWSHGNMSEGKRRSFLLQIEHYTMKQNYLIYVFIGGRNIGTYFSEGLREIASIKAVNKGCEISVYDMSKLQRLTQQQINEISKASITNHEEPQKNKNTAKQAPKKRFKKNKRWERSIKCVETGKVFKSIKECSEQMDIPHKAIWNALNSGKPRRGFHFVNVKNKKNIK